jgi:hypothetical protein
MATASQMLARIIDIFGPAGAANPSKLYGNLMVSPAGNILVGSTTDNGVQKLQVTGNALVSGYVARGNQPAFSFTQYYYTTNSFADDQVVVMGSRTMGRVSMSPRVSLRHLLRAPTCSQLHSRVMVVMPVSDCFTMG